MDREARVRFSPSVGLVLLQGESFKILPPMWLLVSTLMTSVLFYQMTSMDLELQALYPVVAWFSCAFYSFLFFLQIHLFFHLIFVSDQILPVLLCLAWGKSTVTTKHSCLEWHSSLIRVFTCQLLFSQRKQQLHLLSVWGNSELAFHCSDLFVYDIIPIKVSSKLYFYSILKAFPFCF